MNRIRSKTNSAARSSKNNSVLNVSSSKISKSRKLKTIKPLYSKSKTAIKKATVFDRLYKSKANTSFNIQAQKEDPIFKELRRDFERLELEHKVDDKDSRKFRMHKFVFEKKKKN